MIVKMSRYGKYLACPNFPSCKNIKPYHTGEEKEEISDVDCDKCGAKMVYRQGPYGRYLKCPECGQNKAIVIDTGIECPKCHEGHLVKRRSKRGRYFYGCSRYPACDMAVWDEPVNEFCSVCGAIKVKKVRKIRRKSLSALIPSAQRIRKENCNENFGSKEKDDNCKEDDCRGGGENKNRSR